MDIAIYAERSKLFNQRPPIESLARESQVPIDDVARLYGNELAKLEVGARIYGFLPIFAIRKVREMLRQRSAEKRPLVQTGGGWNGWMGRAPGSARGSRLDARLLARRGLPASRRQLNCTGGDFLW